MKVKSENGLFGDLSPSRLRRKARLLTSGNHNTTSPRAMDIGHFYSSPADRYSPRLRQQTDGLSKPKDKATAKVKPSAGSDETTRKAMVDNKGWRKKIGGKPKEGPPFKTDLDDTAATPPVEVLGAADAIDKRRHGWRKTIAVSRPTTPMATAPLKPALGDAGDTRNLKPLVTHRSSLLTKRSPSIRYSRNLGTLKTHHCKQLPGRMLIPS